MMIAYNSNEDSPHTDVAWFLWYAADSAHALGQLVSIDYSDSTPDVAFTYDRLGRQLTVTDILGTRTNVYDALNLLEERHPDGTTLVRSYDLYGRPSGIALGPDYAVGYGYDEYGRFSTVAVSNGATFTYSYVPSSSLLSGYTNDLGLSVAYEYEPHRDVKTLVSNAWSTNTISTFAYTYDAIGRRNQRIDDGTTTNLFGYNFRSELVSAEMGTNTYAYAYDPIGNRLTSTENGTTTTYAANALNQYTALNPASSNPTPFTYDPDGNMTSDGTWSYAWDAENRLIEVQPLVTNLGSALVQYMYDAQSRRIARREFSWNVFSGVTNWYYVQGRAYRYDGWNLLHELKPHGLPKTMVPYILQTNLYLTGVNGLVAAEYIWGLDLSSSLHGAGGTGGLLKVNRGGTNTFSFYDANGNITITADSTGNVMEMFSYDGFGKEIGLPAVDFEINYLQFSTKYGESIIRALYYGYRFYNSKIGRWINYDPIGEDGGNNLYRFTQNNSVNGWDNLGLKCCVLTWPGYPGHSSLKCDNGVYISKFPSGGGTGMGSSSGGVLFSSPSWHTERQDYERYGRGPISEICISCLDESAVADWYNSNKSQNYTLTCANCADAVVDAISSGLGEKNKPDKKTCGQLTCPQKRRGCYYRVIDLGSSAGITTPHGISKRMSELSENGCSRYKCKLSCPSPSHH